MKASTETKQPERGQVSAQAPKPKDDESDFQEQRFQKCLDDIQESVSSYPVEWRPKLLAAALEQATKEKGATEKLVAMEEQVRNVCDKLDVKTKAVLAVLGELSSVAGISNDVGSYGTDLLNSTYQGKALVDEALQQSPGDSDLAFLSEVYELAHSVTGAEGKLFQQEIAAEEETTTTAQPQTTEPDDTEPQDQPEQEQPAELSVSEQTLERLKGYYKNLDPRTKLAIATLSEIQFLDGINFQARKPREERLITAIWDDLESVCLEIPHSEQSDFSSEDVWLAGVWEAVNMVIQNC